MKTWLLHLLAILGINRAKIMGDPEMGRASICLFIFLKKIFFRHGE